MFWQELFIFVDSCGVKVLIPYLIENGSPKIFFLFSRDLRNDKWIFPLNEVVFARIIDNKVLLSNKNFEFVFLSVTNRLILMAFQLELGNIDGAFDLIKNEAFDIQLTCAKIFYV